MRRRSLYKVYKDIILQDEEGDNLYVTDDDQLDEFHEMPSCRGVVEWINCLIFDCILLLIEVATSLWLASRYACNFVSLFPMVPYVLTICYLPPKFNKKWFGEHPCCLGTAFTRSSMLEPTVPSWWYWCCPAWSTPCCGLACTKATVPSHTTRSSYWGLQLWAFHHLSSCESKLPP